MSDRSSPPAPLPQTPLPNEVGGERRARRSWIPRLRYSLRTLPLLVLLIASGGALWWNWGPWTLVCVIEEPAAIYSVKFSDDDRFIMFHYFEDSPSGLGNACLDIRHIENGARHALLKGEPGANAVGVWGDYVVMVAEVDLTGALQHHSRIFNWRHNRELAWKEKLKFMNQKPLTWRMGYGFVQATYADRRILYQLPELNAVKEFPGDFVPVSFLRDGRIAVDYPDHVEVHDLIAHTSVRSPVLKSHDPLFDSSPVLKIQYLPKGKSPLSFQLWNPAEGSMSRVFDGQLQLLFANGRRALIGRWDIDRSTVIDVESGAVIYQFDDAPTLFSAGADPDLLLSQNGQMYDALTGKLLWAIPATGCQFSGDGNYVFGMMNNDESHAPTLFDARNGRRVFDVSPLMNRDLFSTDYHVLHWAKHSSDFAITTYKVAGEISPPAATRRAAVMRLTRSVNWYGPAWLPEFWLTLALFAALIWSLIRDRRDRRMA